jgi:hypothetical protein
MKSSRSSCSSLPLITAALATAGLISTAHAQIQTAGTLFVDVDATALPYGALVSVTNTGTLGGVFQGFSSPLIADSPGGAARGIQFGGVAYMQLVTAVGGAKIAPPAGLVGVSPTRSIEVWAFNPTIADEETLLSWGRRGGPDGSNMSFNYGLNAQFGAVGHWGAAGPDMGWSDSGGAPVAGQWHHLAYTFDGTTTRVYADGALANSEVLSAGLINTHANTAITLAAQLEADGVTVTGTLRGSLTLAKARIHDGVLTPAQILNNYNEERLQFAGPVRLTLSPTNTTAVEGGPATFTVQASGDPPISYQWLRGGTPIPAATSNSYTLEEVTLGDQGATFAALATNVLNGTGALTTNATLSVTPDTTSPALLAAAAGSQSSLTVLDGVGVAFSEKISVSTANDTGSYVLTGPDGVVPISAATIDLAGRSVFLSTAQLTPGASYLLAVNGIRDRAAAANLIAPGSQANFTASQFAIINVGPFSAGSSATPVPGGYDISATGQDIGGTADEFGFHARVYVGDFDVQVRVESLELSDGYSEAGLMARPQSAAANDMFAGVFASPSLAGLKFQSRATTGAAASSSGSLPVNYPYTWLRLQRAGNAFTGLGSLDGSTWQRLGAATLAMPISVLVGFAVNSHQTNSAVLARFREPEVAAGGAMVNSLVLPFEPLGPSSRRTGLILSEIMYHPAEVTGVTGSLEYIEIFNGQDYLEDLSGFRIDGDIHFDFPAGTMLPSGGFLVIARNPAVLQSHYGISGVLGPWRMTTNVTAATTNVTTESLPNSSGTVRLENELGAHLIEVEYDSEGEWPAAADGAGHSLILARPSYGQADPRAWAASELVGGSPGRREAYASEPQRAVVINEFLAHTDPPQFDSVELFNTGTQPVDLGGCWLSDDFGTNKYRIANGTILGPRSFMAFTETQLGFNLSSDGEEILLVNSNQTRVIDAVRFGGQANGVARGRYPDGSSSFCELATPTLGTNNAACLRRDIVINEIMYNPISGNDDDEFIELHNRGTSAADLGFWRLDNGVNFTIPAGTILQPGGYLVLAKNRTNLLARYPDLAANPSRVIGNYGGQLANGGERVVLAMPDLNIRTNSAGFPVTNIFYIAVNEVSYRDGGRWGDWSDGGGSSLELIDPRADNRLAANWADSDETQKAPWTLIERTGLIDLGMVTATSNPDRLEMFIEGPGECLVDDVEVRNNGGTNRVVNPGFEMSDATWAFQGTHRRSFVQNQGARTGSGVLHLRAVERGDAGANRIRTGIQLMTTGGANTATLRAWVRWLRGERNILLRIRGQWIECAGSMSVPSNLGTPGAVNSRRIANAGPAIAGVAHAPILPAANEPIVVTAQVDDADGLASFTLRYRLDPDTSVTDLPMRDDGSGGDAVAGDGLYSATIPGQPDGTMLAFHLRATDGHATPASTLFPNDAPFRECLVRFGETVPSGSIATYRLWLTRSNLTFWAQRERNANDGMDCTFVYGNWRVVYNALSLYSGSPWHTANQPYTGPLGNTCDYEVEFPEDDLLLGQQDFVLNTQAPVTTFFDNDTSAQAETTAYWLGRKLGLGFNHKRHVFVHLNGQSRGMVFFDHQQPNQDIIEEYYPNDADGRLHKIEDWFEFDDAGSAFNIVTCTLQDFLVGGQKRTERYRWTWRPRARTAPNDFADLFALVDVANGARPEPLTSAVKGLVDVPQWMRHFALQHTVGNWDTYGYERGKNCFAYKPTQGPWKLLLWDLDLVLGKQSRTPTDPLFNTAGSEPVIGIWFTHPPFVREFWCAMSELVNGPMLPANYNPLVDARYAAFRANEVPVDSPAAMKLWIDQRRTFILTQIPNATFVVNGADSLATTTNYLTLTGTAPVTAKDILVNGAEYPITWLNVTNWSIRIPLAAGANTLVVTAKDADGGLLGSRTVTATYSGAVPDPAGHVVINEIMFNPPVDQTSFIELYNAHPTITFDLSNWRVNGLSYTFAPGAVLPPRSFAVLGRNRAEYAKLFGGLTPFSAQFDGALDNDGETLTLLRPGALAGEEIIVDKVKFEGRDPWPAAARGAGSSLQLLDLAQDNARVSNWTDGTGWRFYSFTGIPSASRLLLYFESAGQLYLDDLRLVPGSVPGVGQNLLVNGDFESPLSPTWKLQGTNGTNTVISTAEHYSGNSSLDLRFFPQGSAANYLYQDITGMTTTAPHTLSFWYLPSGSITGNLRFRLSSAFFPSFNVRGTTGPAAVSATPGATNIVVIPISPYPLVWLNEVLPLNTDGLTDAQGEREPWIELYNSSAEPLALEGMYLSDDFVNLTKWAFPPGATLQLGEFRVVFADGESNEGTPGQWHAGFRLNSGTGSVALSRVVSGVPQIVDYLNFEGLGDNRSYGSCPDGQLFDRQELFFTTPASPNNCAAAPLVVRINEWMAGNSGFIRDPADNDADDWFELYNPNSFTVDLGGYFLTDNLAPEQQLQFPIPNNGHYTIPPGGYLLVWADGEAVQNSTNRADLHASFSLRQASEAIGLFAADGTQIDAISFGQQTNNVSEGRYPDGAAPRYFMLTPTPRAANVIPGTVLPPQITGLTLLSGGVVQFSFGTTAGHSYQVFYKDDLNDSEWLPLASPQAGNGTTFTVTDNIGASAQRFYNVVVQ